MAVGGTACAAAHISVAVASAATTATCPSVVECVAERVVDRADNRLRDVEDDAHSQQLAHFKGMPEYARRVHQPNAGREHGGRAEADGHDTLQLDHAHVINLHAPRLQQRQVGGEEGRLRADEDQPRPRRLDAKGEGVDADEDNATRGPGVNTVVKELAYRRA